MKRISDRDLGAYTAIALSFGMLILAVGVASFLSFSVASAQQQTPQMTPTQALQILDQAVSGIDATRQEHVTLQTAVRVLDAALVEWEQLKAAKTDAVESQE